MGIDAILVIASLSGTVLVGVGLMKTWRRNGAEQCARDVLMSKERAERDARIDAKLDGVGDKMEINITHVTEAKGKLDVLTTHCAGTVASFAEKHEQTERRLKGLEYDKAFHKGQQGR